jgi:hypothetical protein
MSNNGCLLLLIYMILEYLALELSSKSFMKPSPTQLITPSCSQIISSFDLSLFNLAFLLSPSTPYSTEYFACSFAFPSPSLFPFLSCSSLLNISLQILLPYPPHHGGRRSSRIFLFSWTTNPSHRIRSVRSKLGTKAKKEFERFWTKALSVGSYYWFAS